MKKYVCILAALLLSLATMAQEKLSQEKLPRETEKTQDIDEALLRQIDSISNLFNLQEVTVQAELPKTRMKGDAIVTRIAGSVLAKAGTAEDALSKVPGLIRRNGTLEVIGKGSPVYYINGRRVQDTRELQNLRSQDIREVEVITTPGAQYGGDVNAVVKIRTTQREGEGFGLSLDARDAFCPRYLNNQVQGNLNLQYRYRGLEVFGGIGADDNRLKHFSTETEQNLYDENVTFTQRGGQTFSQHYTSLRYLLGADWQINENHTLGVRMERNDNLVGLTDMSMTDSVFRNGALHDVLRSQSNTTSNGLDTWLAQAYYSGHAGKLGIDFNLDYYNTKQTDRVETTERAQIEDREVSTNAGSLSHMAAGKLVFSYPFKVGTLNVGTEMTFMRRKNHYKAVGADLPSDNSSVRDDHYALFAEYGVSIPKAGVLNMGLRYEYTDLRYTGFYDDPNVEDRIGRHNVYPSLSFATRIGEVQGSLAYSLKAYQPPYRHLRTSVEYNNRYTLTTGNPELMNELNHQLGLNARWRFISGALSYECKKYGIFDWAFPYDEEGQVMLTWMNLAEPIHRLSAFLNLSPSVGHWSSEPALKIWQPNITLGVQKQWLTLELEDPREPEECRIVHYDRPMWIFNWGNAFTFPTRSHKHGPWQVELNSELYSGGHWGNAEVTGISWNLSFAIQKSWLENDALSLRLQVNDICHMASIGAFVDMGSYTLRQSRVNDVNRSLYDPQTITLSMSYTLNTNKTPKHRSGAGEDTRKRM